MIRHPDYAFVCSLADSPDPENNVWRGGCGVEPPAWEGGRCYDFMHDGNLDLVVERVDPLNLSIPCVDYDNNTPILDNDFRKYPWPPPPPIGLGCYETNWVISQDVCEDFIAENNCDDIQDPYTYYHPCCHNQEDAIHVQMEYTDNDNCMPVIHLNIDPSLLGGPGGEFLIPRWGAGCITRCTDVYPDVDPSQPGESYELWDYEVDGALCLDLRDPDDDRCSDIYEETDDEEDFRIYNSQGSYTIKKKKWYDVKKQEGEDEYAQTKLEPADPASGECDEDPGCSAGAEATCFCYKFRKMKRQVLLNRCCEEVYERWAPVEEGEPPEPVIVEEGFICKEEDVEGPENPLEGGPPPHGISYVVVNVVSSCDTEMWFYLDQVGLQKKYNKLSSCDGSWEFVTLEDVAYKSEGYDYLVIPGAVCGCMPQ